jgi:hypothetical protein
MNLLGIDNKLKRSQGLDYKARQLRYLFWQWNNHYLQQMPC